MINHFLFRYINLRKHSANHHNRHLPRIVELWVRVKETVLEKEKSDNWEWDWKHATADMLWNLVFISARVVTLALFAAYEPYYFWSLIVAQIVIVTIVIFSICIRNDNTHSVFYHFIISCFTGFGMVFNMFFAHPNIAVPYGVYLLYWLLIFIENTVMILLWFIWSSELDLWYHNVAIGCLIPAYVLALIIKSIQCYFYNDERISLSWKFYDPIFYDSPNVTASTAGGSEKTVGKESLSVISPEVVSPVLRESPDPVTPHIIHTAGGEDVIFLDHGQQAGEITVSISYEFSFVQTETEVHLS